MLKFKKVHQMQSGEYAFSNTIPIGKYDWDAIEGNRNGVPYIWSLDLPGNKREGRAANEEQAKIDIQGAYDRWLIAAGLKVQ